ncbi:MAG: Ig domain-containing protein [Pirellulaceae bacterium]
MSKREKILAAAVGGVILVAIGLYVLNNVNQALTAKWNQVEQAESRVRQKQRAVLEGQFAREKIAQYEQRSLPADLAEARSQYQEWLIAVTYEFFGENKMLVKPSGGESARGGVYDRLEYSIAGEGNLDELTRFLHRFYDVNYLHRIDTLRVQPIADSKNLKINCEIEALVVKTTAKQQLGEEQGDRLPPGSLDAYRADILARNVFGKPNEPPQLSSIRSQSVYRNESFRQTVSAREPDPLDKLSYQLEEYPSGMRITQRDQSAELSWTPTRNGTYDVTVSVADDGLPSKSDFVTFQIEVGDRPDPPPRTVTTPPPPPRFDYAKYTFLTSVQAIDGQPVVWLYSRPTGKKIVCGVGDELEVGDYQALVKAIDVDHNEVELEVEDEVLVLSLGENLREARRKSSGEVGRLGSSGVAPGE